MTGTRSFRTGKVRTGPHRNAQTHKAIIESTWRLLESVGYHALRIEKVAADAGVGKATIYRWWPSKSALAAEAIATRLDLSPIPNSGDPRQDLKDGIQITIDNYRGTVAGVALPALVAELVYDEDGYAAFHESFLRPRREASAQAVRRAIKAGLLPADTDAELLLDTWAGAIFYRVLISHQPFEPDLAEKLTALILGETRPGADGRGRP